MILVSPLRNHNNSCVILRRCNFFVVSNGNPSKYGVTWNNSLLFGGEHTGELITSKRTSGIGQYGVGLVTGFRERMHIGRDGAIGVGTTNGSSPTTPIAGRFNIHNFNSGENNFYKNINLYTSAQYNGASDRVGVANHIWSSSRGNSIAMNGPNGLHNNINSYYSNPPINLFPFNTIGINNNLRQFTGPGVQNPLLYNYTYGIVNDLNDQKIAKFTVNPPPPIPPSTFYRPRVGILNVTNTNRGNIGRVSFGTGKIGIWNINAGGFSGGSANLIDGWAQWNDGQTFLRYAPITTSDKKLKNKIKSINQDEVLERIQSLEPVTYEFKKRPGIVENGFLAQNLQEVFPKTVIKSINPVTKEELLGVQYQQLHSLQIAAIQAQQKLIKKLEKRITVLEKRINRKR